MTCLNQIFDLISRRKIMNFETSPCHVDHFLKTKYCYAIEQIISLFCYYEKKNQFFLGNCHQKCWYWKKLKVILNKKMENFYQQKKICKKQLLLVFFDSLSKTDTQTALNDSTTIINWKMLKELLIKKTHNDVIKKLMWPKKWLICEKNSSTFSLVPSNTIWRPFFIFL